MEFVNKETIKEIVKGFDEFLIVKPELIEEDNNFSFRLRDAEKQTKFYQQTFVENEDGVIVKVIVKNGTKLDWIKDKDVDVCQVNVFDVKPFQNTALESLKSNLYFSLTDEFQKAMTYHNGKFLTYQQSEDKAVENRAAEVVPLIRNVANYINNTTEDKLNTIEHIVFVYKDEGLTIYSKCRDTQVEERTVSYSDSFLSDVRGTLLEILKGSTYFPSIIGLHQMFKNDLGDFVRDEEFPRTYRRELAGYAFTFIDSSRALLEFRIDNKAGKEEMVSFEYQTKDLIKQTDTLFDAFSDLIMSPLFRRYLKIANNVNCLQEIRQYDETLRGEKDLKELPPLEEEIWTDKGQVLHCGYNVFNDFYILFNKLNDKCFILLTSIENDHVNTISHAKVSNYEEFLEYVEEFNDYFDLKDVEELAKSKGFEIGAYSLGYGLKNREKGISIGINYCKEMSQDAWEVTITGKNCQVFTTSYFIYSQLLPLGEVVRRLLDSDKLIEIAELNEKASEGFKFILGGKKTDKVEVKEVDETVVSVKE